MASEAQELNEPAGTGHARPGPARFWLANVRDLLGILVGVLAAAAVIVAGINHATAGLDARMLSMESRFQEMDARWDVRFREMESRWDARARTMEQRLREDIAVVREEVSGGRRDVTQLGGRVARVETIVNDIRNRQESAAEAPEPSVLNPS